MGMEFPKPTVNYQHHAHERVEPNNALCAKLQELLQAAMVGDLQCVGFVALDSSGGSVTDVEGIVTGLDQERVLGLLDGLKIKIIDGWNDDDPIVVEGA